MQWCVFLTISETNYTVYCHSGGWTGRKLLFFWLGGCNWKLLQSTGVKKHLGQHTLSLKFIEFIAKLSHMDCILCTIPDARLKVLPFTELWIGENQFNIEPTRGSCLINPFAKTNTVRDVCIDNCNARAWCSRWLNTQTSQVRWMCKLFLTLLLKTHLFHNLFFIGLQQLLLCLNDAFPHHFGHVLQKLHKRKKHCEKKQKKGKTHEKHSLCTFSLLKCKNVFVILLLLLSFLLTRKQYITINNNDDY